MTKRVSLKIAGASGQGVSSTGSLLARGIKRTGRCVFGYREYPSLIQGGHSTFQLDILNRPVTSTERLVDLMVALNHHGLEANLRDVKRGGLLLHVTPEWRFPPADQRLIDERRLSVVAYPLFDALDRLRASPVVSNVLLASIVWVVLGQDIGAMEVLVRDAFGAHQDMLELNLRCVQEGHRFASSELDGLRIPLPVPDPAIVDWLMLDGGQAMGLGAVHAGVRLFASYPMTPASFISDFLSATEDTTGMIVKQAEDEMTAAQMVSGASWMGTRALTATAGVGFDLMTETLSMNAMMENPFVVILGQRPGPATGLPTWTGQGGLITAVGAGHGEFARCVMAASTSQDAFALMPEAFDISERYQIPVVVLTEKQIVEALYTHPPFACQGAEVEWDRHLVTDPEALLALSSSDRYDRTTPSGVSPRWLPGSRAATYAAQADEHGGAGELEESSANTTDQVDKRMRKLVYLRARLPEPSVRLAGHGDLAGDHDFARVAPELLVIGWGSTGDTMRDVLRAEELADRRIAYLHFTYLWPLRTEALRRWSDRATRVVIVEQNHQSQLAMLLSMTAGWRPDSCILKYDGRPFFYDELLGHVLDEVGVASPA